MKEKYYFFSAPFESLNSGDGDYISALVEAIRKEDKVDAEYITGEGWSYDPNIPSLVKLNESRNRGNEFATSLDLAKKDPRRQAIVKQVIERILADAAHNQVTPRLMLQLRPPETGAMFMPEDLAECKRKGIQVSVTCHEYKLNYDKREYLQAYAQKYFVEADQVIFFNEKDANNAAKHAGHTNFLQDGESPDSRTELGHKKIPRKKIDLPRESYSFDHQLFDLRKKTILSRVPPTTQYRDIEFEEFQGRDPNIIVFGLLRAGKGFDMALALAEKLHQKQSVSPPDDPIHKTKVIIVGKPSDYDLVAKILNQQHNFDAEIKLIQDKIQKIESEVGKRIESLRKEEKIRQENNPTLVQELHQIVKDNLARYSQLVEGTEEYNLEVKRLYERKINIKVDVALKGLISEDSQILELQKKIEVLGQEKSTVEQRKFTPSGVETLISEGKLTNVSFDGSHGFPLEVHLDVPSERMPEMFSKAKYAVKIDEKGWANNASAHINAVANRCVLFTSWGMDTPDDVLPARSKQRPDGSSSHTLRGEFYGAIELPDHKYSLAKGEKATAEDKRSHYRIEQPKGETHKDFITPDTIITKIVDRERDIRRNRYTFDASRKLMAEFAPAVVASRLVSDIERKTQLVRQSSALRGDVKIVDTEDVVDEPSPVGGAMPEEVKRALSLGHEAKLDRDVRGAASAISHEVASVGRVMREYNVQQRNIADKSSADGSSHHRNEKGSRRELPN